MLRKQRTTVKHFDNALTEKKQNNPNFPYSSWGEIKDIGRNEDILRILEREKIMDIFVSYMILTLKLKLGSVSSYVTVMKSIIKDDLGRFCHIVGATLDAIFRELSKGLRKYYTRRAMETGEVLVNRCNIISLNDIEQLTDHILNHKVQLVSDGKCWEAFRALMLLQWSMAGRVSEVYNMQFQSLSWTSSPEINSINVSLYECLLFYYKDKILKTYRILRITFTAIY